MPRVWRLIQGGYAIVKERETFASRLGFVLISAGCAIGLGNVWRFPYIVGQYGGAAFVLIYLLFLVIMGLPIMAMEFSVGRASRKSILASFQVLEPKGSKWHWYGWFGMAGNYLLMMFYTTIAGWLLLYFFKVAAGEFRGLDAAGVENAFGAMQGNVGIQLLFMGIVVVLGMLICSRGLKNGVEKVNKAMMLCLLALLVVLAVRALTLPGAMEGVKFYLVPNFHNLMYDADGSFRLFRAIYDAMGQAFFTLSLGIGAMAIFGSYIGKERRLFGEAINVGVLDTCVAFVSGLIIFPSAFAFGVNPGQGPSLIFVTLPNVFNAMPGGRIVGMIFYICVLFAGVSSIVNLYEAPVAFLQEKLHTNRVLSVVIIGAVGGVIALCIQPWTSQWMDVVSIYICPLGALLAGIMFFWVMKKDTALAAVHEGRTVGKKDISGWVYPLGKWVYCAASLAALILGAIYGGIG